MFAYEQINLIHVELSAKCQASCPVCSRNFYGGKVIPWLNKTEMSLAKFQQYFPVEFLKNLNSLLFCGNYGDPIFAKDLYEICAYCMQCNPNLALRIVTNGGARTEEFWHSLGGIIRNRASLTFSVDGLEDTNHIYRRGVEWRRVFTAMKAFIAGGGNSNWEFLVFQHNEHQVEEARALATSLGIQRFHLRKAFGFIDGNEARPIPVYKDDGTIDYLIHPPRNPDLQNDELRSSRINWQTNYTPPTQLNLSEEMFVPNTQTTSHPNIDASHARHVASSSIVCEASTGKSLFVSAEGLVFPCCYTGSRFYAQNRYNYENFQLRKLTQDYGVDKIDLNQLTLRQIVESGWLQSYFQELWLKSNPDEGKPVICTTMCEKQSKLLKSVTAHLKLEGR